MSLIQFLKSSVAPRIRIRKKSGGYIIVDFRDEYIRLPDGTVIPRNRIIQIDTERKVVVYLDENNVLREAKYA